MTIVSRTRAWLRPRDLALLTRAFLLLARMRIALWLLPWRRVLRLLRCDVTPAATMPVERLERAIRAASHFVPRATCLTQALALSSLLSRCGHPARVRIGVATDHGRFAAHAWVECGGATLLSSAADVEKYSPLLAWTPAHPDLFR
jgi:hypothetical protein